jgi:Ca2+-binding RTX toxin-like protein
MADIPNNATTTAVLETAIDSGGAMAGTYSGRLETVGDRDWVRVTLVAGQQYNIYASLQWPGHSKGDSTLRVYNSLGEQVGFADNEGSDFNPFLQVAATATGTYFIEVADHADDTGAYSVLVTTRNATNIGSETNNGNVITAGAGERIAGGWGSDNISLGADGFDALGEQGDDILAGNDLGNLLSGGQGNDFATGMGGVDLIFGDAGDDLLFGGLGNDQLFGGDGFDWLLGGDDADTLSGGPDGDRLDGGNGTDQAIYASASAGVVADLQTPTANTGDAADDRYTAIENLFGSAFGDTLRGNGYANYLKGEAGNDTLVGRLGRDVLAGGLGSDRFLYNGVTDSGTTEATRDVITDFVNGQDKINLSAIDAIAATAANDAFVLLARGTSVSAVGTGHVGWYWLDYAEVVNDKTILRINNDGDSYIEMTIELRGLINLAATDFNL